jgi:hypothetical protein
MKPTLPLVVVSLVWAPWALAQTAAPSAGWQQSQHRDAADTYTFTRFELVGKFVGGTPAQAADRPALRVDCIPAAPSHRSRLLAADLLVGKTLKIVYVEPEEIHGIDYFPKVDVHYSTDGSSHKQQQWSAGTDRIPTAKPSDKTSATIPRDAFKRIMRAHTASITVSDENDAPLEMQFEIPDSKAVESVCRIG